jgi:predicted phosphodiesterase
MQRLLLITLGFSIAAALAEAGDLNARTSPGPFRVSGQQAAKQTEAVALPLKPGSVRFGVIGDSGTGDRAQYDVAEEMLRIQRFTQFNFVIMLGDNLYGGSSPSDYLDKFERPYKPLLDAGVKFYASLGNHDNSNEISYAPFHMGGNRYYTFTQGTAQFFVLDSNYMDGGQLGWLAQELQKSAAPWKIGYFHHPLFSAGKKHGGNLDLRAALEPLFEKFGVQVVLSGHDHIYERTKPLGGTVYFILGNSGQLRPHGLAPDAQEAAGYDVDLCFMVAEIAGDSFYFQTISRGGGIIDSGVIPRNPRGDSGTR